MTHVVVWIDHKEARIFRVHPEAADESRILSPQHQIHRHPKAVGSHESTRMTHGISLTTSHEDSTGSTRSSLSGRLQRSTNSSSSCTNITDSLYLRS
jgi:hypothetical protein